MPLYEVVITEVPTKKEKKDGAEEKIIFGPKIIVAKDPEIAASRILLEIGDIYIHKNKTHIFVRHFTHSFWQKL